MAHRRILTADQRRALFGLPDDEGECRRRYALDDDDLRRIGRRRKPENRLGFALQLCALRFPGRLLKPGEAIPEAMLRVIADQIDTDWRDIAGYGLRENTRYEHSAALQQELGYRPFMGAARAELERWLAGAALMTCDGADLADAFMTALRDARVIAPSPSTFERLCAAALVEAERQVSRILVGALGPHHVAALDDLLVLPEEARLTPLGALRAAPASAGTAGLHDLLNRLDQLRALGLPSMPSAAPMPRVTRLAQECARITDTHLREMNAARRSALLFAFVADALPRVTDIAIDAALGLIGSLFKRAERRCMDALVENRRGIGDIVRVHADLAVALINGRAEGRDLSAVVEESVGWATLARSAETAARLRSPVAADVLERIDAEHPRLRRVRPALPRRVRIPWRAGRHVPPGGARPIVWRRKIRWRKRRSADGLRAGALAQADPAGGQDRPQAL